MNTLLNSSIHMIFNNNKPVEGSFNEYGHESIYDCWCTIDNDIVLHRPFWSWY
ncbi:MAG: hypothetical protein ACI4WH_05890 [Oscillospiraceae bacterium]